MRHGRGLFSRAGPFFLMASKKIKIMTAAGRRRGRLACLIAGDHLYGVDEQAEVCIRCGLSKNEKRVGVIALPEDLHDRRRKVRVDKTE